MKQNKRFFKKNSKGYGRDYQRGSVDLNQKYRAMMRDQLTDERAADLVFQGVSKSVMKKQITELPDMYLKPKTKTFYSGKMQAADTPNSVAGNGNKLYKMAAELFQHCLEVVTTGKATTTEFTELGRLPINDDIEGDDMQFRVGLKPSASVFTVYKHTTDEFTHSHQINSGRLGLGYFEMTVGNIMLAAAGYMDSASWYANNGYEKVDDYIKLTLYASSTHEMKTNWAQQTDPDKVSDLIQSNAQWQYGRECSTLIFIDYNEFKMKQKGLERTADGYAKQGEKTKNVVDQFVFLNPELFIMNRDNLLASLEAMAHYNVKFQANKQAQLWENNDGAYSATEISEFLKKQINALKDNQAEYFKPSVNVPYTECLERIIVFTPQWIDDGNNMLTTYHPQFKLSVTPTYSRMNALAVNPFTGFYKRPVSRYIFGKGIIQTTSGGVQQLKTLMTKLPLRLVKGTADQRLEEMSMKETISRAAVIKAMQQHMSKDSQLSELRQFVNLKMMYAGCSLKCVQWLSAYSTLDVACKEYKLHQELWYSGNAVALQGIHHYVSNLYDWRKMIPVGTTMPIPPQEKSSSFGNSIFAGERIRKLAKIYNRDMNTFPQVKLLAVTRRDDKYEAETPFIRDKFVVDLNFLGRFIKSYRKVSSQYGKNPYLFDTFLHTMLGVGIDVEQSKLSKLNFMNDLARQSGADKIGKRVFSVLDKPINGFDAQTRVQMYANTSVGTLGDGDSLHRWYKQMTVTKLSGDPTLQLWALTSQPNNANVEQPHISTFKQVMSEQMNYNVSETIQHPEVVFRRYTQFARMYSDPSMQEPMTCLEYANPALKTRLYHFVVDLYLLVLVHYSFYTYKGCSDFDMYYFLAHASSWIVDADKIMQKNGYSQFGLIASRLPVYRTKMTDYAKKTERVNQTLDVQKQYRGSAGPSTQQPLNKQAQILYTTNEQILLKQSQELARQQQQQLQAQQQAQRQNEQLNARRDVNAPQYQDYGNASQFQLMQQVPNNQPLGGAFAQAAQAQNLANSLVKPVDREDENMGFEDDVANN